MSNFYIWFIFVSYFVVGALLMYGIYKLPATIRSIRIKNLAKKYNLKYTRIIGVPKFEFEHSGKGKRNLITGYINGCKIEIYDYIKERGSIGDYSKQWHTKLIVGETTQNKKGIFNGYFALSVGSIEKYINQIKQGGHIK